MLKTFQYHKPSPEGLRKITELREAFSQVSAVMERNCPITRERSIAYTDLETAAMWAIKSVVFNDPESEALV